MLVKKNSSLCGTLLFELCPLCQISQLKFIVTQVPILLIVVKIESFYQMNRNLVEDIRSFFEILS